MRIGISDKYLDPYYLPLLGEFDFVEYQVYKTEELKKLDMVEKSCYVHLPDPAADRFLDLVRAVSKIKCVELINIHARPFDEYFICKNCGSRLFIPDSQEFFCPECETLYQEKELSEMKERNSLEKITETIQTAYCILEAQGKRLSVENTFETPEQMKRIISALPKPVGFTCDIGHAQIFHTSALDYISMLGKRLVHLHIHDNFGGSSDWYHDLHISPGKGAVKWNAILNMLRFLRYQGTGTFESKATMNWVREFRTLQGDER